MGFGHRVYRAEDPRARHMRAGVEKLSREMGQPKWYQILEALVEAMKPYARHGVNVNVDFYAGVVYYLNGIADDLFVPIFAVGRVPGWTVQVLEQMENNILIRPLTLYNGPQPREYVPLRPALSKHRRGGDDVVDARAAREVADGTRETLQDRADGARAGKVLGELVGDVAGVEIREYQHVGAPRHGAFGLHLLLCNGIDERCVGLQLAVDRESRVACSSDLKRAYDLLRTGVACAALRREGKQRDARLFLEQRAAARGRSKRDVGELLGVRLDVDRAIGIDQNPFLQDHQEEARRGADALCEPDRHQPGLDHAGRGMRDPGEHRVGIARLDHHAGMQQRFAHRALGDPRIAVELGIRGEPRARLRIERQDWLGEPLALQPARSLDDAFVADFRQHDAARPLASPLE